MSKRQPGFPASCPRPSLVALAPLGGRLLLARPDQKSRRATGAGADREPDPPKAGYEPVHMPMPEPTAAVYNENSLWRSGSREFFKDQRAHQGRRHPDRDGEHHRYRQDRQRDPAQPVQQRGSGGSRTSSAPRPSRIRRTAVLPRRILTADLTGSSDGKGFDQLPGGGADQRCRRGDTVAAQRQSCRRGQAGSAGQFRNPRAGSSPASCARRTSRATTPSIPPRSREACIAYGGRGQITDVQQAALRPAGARHPATVLN